MPFGVCNSHHRHVKPIMKNPTSPPAPLLKARGVGTVFTNSTTQNLFIKGENLEVLKVLQKAYYGKMKCVIIDPPYNTGSDGFILP